MKILSRTRHLPIAENCAQIISILKRNHWNLSILLAPKPRTAFNRQTDIRPDVDVVKCENQIFMILLSTIFGLRQEANYKFSSDAIFRIFHCAFLLIFLIFFASLFFLLVGSTVLPSDLCACLLEIQFNFHFSCTGCGISYEFLRMRTGRVCRHILQVIIQIGRRRRGQPIENSGQQS